METISGFIRMAAQVKVESLGRDKWQFEIRVNPELTGEERDRAIHARAARIAKTNRENKTWPADGEILVWYAEIDDLERVKNEVDWHPLKTN